MTRPDLTEILTQLGLTQIEAAIYLSLLEHGQQQAGAITKLTGIHRRTVYDAIARLVEKGLLAYIKTNHTRIYQAVHPERLLDIVREHESQLTSHMAVLEQLYDQQPTRHETVFYRGKKGLKTLFDDQLVQSDTTLLYLGATPAAVEQLRYYFPQFDRQRVRKNIRVHLLFDQRATKRLLLRDIPLSESRKLAVMQPQDVVTCIYGDSIAIVTFSENPFGVLVREAAVAAQYRNWFAVLWSAAKRVS